MVNLMFMFLNLLPILPLDGGRIVASLLPRAPRGATPSSSRWGMPLLLVLLRHQRAQLRARRRWCGALATR